MIDCVVAGTYSGENPYLRDANIDPAKVLVVASSLCLQASFIRCRRNSSCATDGMLLLNGAIAAVVLTKIRCTRLTFLAPRIGASYLNSSDQYVYSRTVSTFAREVFVLSLTPPLPHPYCAIL